MSIFIKGVNAPNNCYDCINSDGGEPFELLSNCRTFGDLCEGKITVDELPKDKRSDFCPVKQLSTPHGKLIDAEKLLIALTNDSHGLSAEQVITIMEFPTIIEMEA